MWSKAYFQKEQSLRYFIFAVKREIENGWILPNDEASSVVIQPQIINRPCEAGAVLLKPS